MGPDSKHVPMIFFLSYNELKQLQKSKWAYIEVHARMQPAPGVTGNLIGNKIADKITKRFKKFTTK